jgi:thioredoxin-like negative regulator of GroEL
LVEELRKLRLEFSELHERATANPSDVSIRFRLGQVAQQLDRPELAQGWFRAVLAMDPQHEDARRGLAQLLTEKP